MVDVLASLHSIGSWTMTRNVKYFNILKDVVKWIHSTIITYLKYLYTKIFCNINIYILYSFNICINLLFLYNMYKYITIDNVEFCSILIKNFNYIYIQLYI